MAKRRKKSKKQNVLLRIVIAIGKALWWVLEGIFRMVVWVGKKIFWTSRDAMHKVNEASKKRKEQKSKATRKQKAKERFGEAKYQPFEILETVSGDFEDFEERLLEESLIVAVAGKRGSGKSSLGFSILENIHAKKKRPCAVLGVPPHNLPAYIESIADINQAKNDSLVLVDEGAISFSSRSSMSKKNKELADLLAIARHKGLTLILITQNTGMLDKNVLNLCDTVLLKQGSLLQSEMERPVIKKLYGKAAPKLKALKGKEKKAGVYVVDGDFEGLVKVGLPSFWTDALSKNRQ